MQRALWILVAMLGLACGGSDDGEQDSRCTGVASWVEHDDHRGCELPDGTCYGYSEGVVPATGDVSSYGSCYYDEPCGLWRIACVECESGWLLWCAGDCPLGAEHERCD